MAATGHSGNWTLKSQSNGSLNGRTRQSWRQVGDGPWKVTGDWFTATETSNSNGTYQEYDNGLNVTLLPGEVGTFFNSTYATATSNQTLTKTGAPNNYVFTSQLNTNDTQSTYSVSNVSFPKKNQGATTKTQGELVQIAISSETGTEINDQAKVSNVSVWQLVMNSTAQDGFSYAPGQQSTGHTRMTIGAVVKISGNSPSSTGKKQIYIGEGMWGTTPTNGRTQSWGSQGGGTWLAPQNVTLSEFMAASASPPASPAASAPPPQPISGNAADEFDALLKRRALAEANGQTPPPLTAGSAPIYGSDGNRTAQEAMVEAGQMIQGMTQMAITPLKFLPGIGQAAVLADAFMNLMQGNVLEAAMSVSFALNPCGLVTKGLAAVSLANNISDMIANGATVSNVAGSLFDLMAMFGACFTGDMLVRCKDGKKRADAISEGDLLWSRDEHDPDGPLVLKRVLHVFVRTAKVWHVRVPGQVLRTTGEHPFWVENRQSWLPVGELRVGDVLRTDDGALLAVEGIEDSGKWERVYNWEVEDYHTYFVSASEDAPSIWAHNASCTVTKNRTRGNAFRDRIARFLRGRGYIVGTEQYIPTPYGKRYIDIVVKDTNGNILSGLETKLGGSRYHALQRLKDNWIAAELGWMVNLVRG